MVLLLVSQNITLRLLQKLRPEQRIMIAEEEFGDDINFTIQDKNGNAKDLTGIIPSFQVWSKGMQPFIDAECDIVVAVDGTCKYTLKESDLGSRTGTFYAKVVLKTGTTKRESTETFQVVVQE